MPVTIGGTNTPGDQARLFQWQMEHYIVRGGPNDPTLQTNTPPTSGGYLSWNSTVTLQPVAGTQTPPNLPLPRVQSLLSTGTIGTTVANNNGGIFVGTIPQGAWITGIEAMVYAAFTTGGSMNGFGLFYAPANTFSTANSPSFVPQTVWLLADLTTGGAANSLYSDAGANGGRLAWTNCPGTGPGQDPASAGPTQLASLGDIDVYAIVFASAALTAGSMAVRLAYTGLEG